MVMMSFLDALGSLLALSYICLSHSVSPTLSFSSVSSEHSRPLSPDFLSYFVSCSEGLLSENTAVSHSTAQTLCDLIHDCVHKPLVVNTLVTLLLRVQHQHHEQKQQAQRQRPRGQVVATSSSSSAFSPSSSPSVAIASASSSSFAGAPLPVQSLIMAIETLLGFAERDSWKWRERE